MNASAPPPPIHALHISPFVIAPPSFDLNLSLVLFSDTNLASVLRGGKVIVGT
jgi:hypothetical protein